MAACLAFDPKQAIPTSPTAGEAKRFRSQIRLGKSRKNIYVILLLMLVTCLPSRAQNDVGTIIRKSVEANNRDWDADPQFDYTETDKDAQGTKTYQVTNILGTPYQRLVKTNGKPLTAEQDAEQESKFKKALAERQAESRQKRAQRISKFQAERRRDHTMLAQLTKAFNFQLQGEQEIEGRKVYVLKATPRKGYQPPNRDSRVLTGMDGTLWIDKATFQWAKVEAHVIHPVSIEGVLAKVEPGTQFELEKMPVEGNIWLTKHYAMTASAKVLSVLPHHSQEDDTYSDYHRRQGSQQKSSDSKDGDSRHGSR